MFLIVQVFSGCSTKYEVITREFCEGLEYPTRVSLESPVCIHIRDIEEKAICASQQYVILKNDYTNLEAYVRNCK